MNTFIIKLGNVYYAGREDTKEIQNIGAIGVTHNQGERDRIITSDQPLVIYGNINLKSHILAILDRMSSGELSVEQICILKTV